MKKEKKKQQGKENWIKYYKDTQITTKWKWRNKKNGKKS